VIEDVDLQDSGMLLPELVGVLLKKVHQLVAEVNQLRADLDELAEKP
jgi:hypothetical protein